MNEDYLKKLVCIRNSTVAIVNADTSTLTECFLDTYIQLPVYTLFALALAYSMGSSAQMPRLITRSVLTLLRLIAALMLLLVSAEVFVNYFTNIYPEWNMTEPRFCTQLVVETYRLVTFALNVFVLFNRNVFHRVFPVRLVVCLSTLVLANVIAYVNRIYAAQKTFDEMELYEKIDILKWTFFNVLLIGYLLTVLLGFKLESMRVLELGIPPQALFSQQPEEDEASYFSYLSFRYFNL